MSKIDLPDGRNLTPYEVQVIRLMLEGLTAQKAAEALNLKPRTIHYHMYMVHKKLGTHSVLQARKRLYELGLLGRVMQETPLSGEQP